VNRGQRLGILIVASLGIALGILIDRLWPNPVYGYQVIAGLAALLLMGLGAVLWRRRRVLASMSIAGGAGLLLGIAIGFNVQPSGPSSTLATVDIALGTPVRATMHATNASCLMVEGRLMYLDSGEGVALADGRIVLVTLSRGEYGPAPDAGPGDQLRVDVEITSVLPDGSPTSTVMGSDPTSLVAMSGAQEAGSVEFSGLVVRPLSELRDPIEVSGSISWECASTP
jgi:hypothetical protein